MKIFSNSSRKATVGKIFKDPKRYDTEKMELIGIEKKPITKRKKLSIMINDFF